MSDPIGPTKGRPFEQWLRSLDSRTERLVRLMELGAPPFLVSNEIDLIREALAAIDVLKGDRATAAAIKSGLEAAE